MKGGITMAIVKASEEALDGIKEVLQRENLKGTNLRVFVQIG